MDSYCQVECIDVLLDSIWKFSKFDFALIDENQEFGSTNLYNDVEQKLLEQSQYNLHVFSLVFREESNETGFRVIGQLWIFPFFASN